MNKIIFLQEKLYTHKLNRQDAFENLASNLIIIYQENLEEVLQQLFLEFYTIPEEKLTLKERLLNLQESLISCQNRKSQRMLTLIRALTIVANAPHNIQALVDSERGVLETNYQGSPFALQFEKVKEKIVANKEIEESIKTLFRNDTDYIKKFLSFLINPKKMVNEKATDFYFLSQLKALVKSLLSDYNILGNIPLCEFPMVRKQAERILLFVGLLERDGLSKILSDRNLYKENRLDNLSQIADEYGVDDLFLRYLDIRHSGITILGDNANLLYAKRSGRYRRLSVFVPDQFTVNTRQVFLGDSPYVCDGMTGEVFYYGKKLPFKIEISYDDYVNQKEPGWQNDLGIFHWYFKSKLGEYGQLEQDKDLEHLSLNIKGSCFAGCPFCMFTHREKIQFLGRDRYLELADVKTDDTLAQIIEVHGPNVFSKIKWITVVEGSFPNLESELRHLKMLKNKLDELGFQGEITAITSFVNTDEAYKELKDYGFSMKECFFPLECFESRDKKLGKNKKYDFQYALERMEVAKKHYDKVKAFLLLGLDSLDALDKHLAKMKEAGIEVQAGAFSIYAPRQYELFADKIKTEQLENGHLTYFMDAAMIMNSHQHGQLAKGALNAFWPGYLNAHIADNSPLRLQATSYGSVPTDRKEFKGKIKFKDQVVPDFIRQDRITEKGAIFEAIKPIIIELEQKNSFLDVGAGVGMLLEPISSHFAESWAIEPNETNIAELARITNNIIPFTLEAGISKINNNFDFILLSHMLYNVEPEKTIEVLDSLIAKLNRGGTLALVLNSHEVSNSKNPNYYDYYKEFGDSSKLRHNPDWLKRELEKKGINVEEVEVTHDIESKSFEQFLEMTRTFGNRVNNNETERKTYLKKCMQENGTYVLPLKMKILIIKKS